MLKLSKRARRLGTVLPLIALAMVGMCGFVALAVDLGAVAVARTQCQNAADVAAMAGARSLNGILPQNTSLATSNAVAAAQQYKILSQPVQAGDVQVQHGTYHYDRVNQRFTPSFSLQAGENYNLTQTTVTKQLSTTFAKVFGISAFNVSGTAIAAHRPRDVAIILDYSGSMNNESDLWNCESYLDNGKSAPDNPDYTSNNAEGVYPLFGHYSNQVNYSDYTHYANLQSPSASGGNSLTGSTLTGKCNVSQPALGVPALVNDFWSNNRGGTASSGFTSAPDSYATTPNGDNYLHVNNTSSQPYAATVNDFISAKVAATGTSFASNGYRAYTKTPFQGYTQGPRYWGKTFFIWPPDPTKDWRQLYFGTNDNTKLWDSGGNWLSPPGNYTINYKAILAWIAANPKVFPPQLRSGNTLFYDSIPADVPASAYDHTQPNYNITDATQRFWKEYIDYVIGVWRDPDGNIQTPAHPSCSYGPDYQFGTVQITTKPSSQYMNYADNPLRPRHRLWFGPMTMIQFMSDTGIFPGTTHDISMYPMKIGIGGALMDIQNNHPNDMVSMILFSRPQYGNDAPGTGSFNLAQYSLTNNYQAIINSLWVPPNSGSADIRPWDPNGAQTPRAHGDYDANTCSSYGFMLAYNQFSGSATLAGADATTPGVGGLGRNGATRLVIYETDGMANQGTQTGSFYNGGPNNSYYPTLPGQSLNSAGYSATDIYQIAQNICNNADGTPGNPPGFAPFSPNEGYPGYATPGKPVEIQCIAFGAIFESPSSIQNQAIALLQQISTIGGSTFPSSPNDPANGFKWCIGDNSQRQTKLRQAFMNITNDTVPISLIK